jgi:hypothetical protein
VLPVWDTLNITGISAFRMNAQAPRTYSFA